VLGKRGSGVPREDLCESCPSLSESQPAADPIRLGRVARILETLAAVDKQVLICHAVLDESYDELAARLGTTRDAVRARHRRALGMLARHLDLPRSAP
jgi:DNA-directed RNA polymerase specialized sigma24 family protein